MIKRFIALVLVTITSAAYSDVYGVEKTDFSRFKKITMAVWKDLHPYCFSDEHGENKGIMIDLWTLWSEKTGICIEFISGTTQELTDMMRNGSVDAHAGLLYSQERNAYFDYVPSPIIRVNLTFFYHKTIFGLKTLQDLAGFKIGVIKGRYSSAYVLEHLPQAALVSYPTLSELTDAAEKGEIRVFIVPIENMRWILKNRGILSEYQFNPLNPLLSEDLLPAVAKGNLELAKNIEQGMALITPEERAAIDRKWLGGSKAKTKDVLTIAMGNDYSPLFFVNDKGDPAGMFPDIWRLWSQKTGQKIEFHAETFSGAIEHLKTCEADVHVGLPRSPERETWMDFFDPMYESQVNFFFPVKYGRFSTVDDLFNHPVGAVQGSVSEQFLKKQYPNIAVTAFESLQQMVWTARDGKIHAFAASSVLTNAMISRLGLSGEFDSMKEALFPVTFHAGIRKGNPELYSLIQQGFDAISYQEMDEIESRWIQNPTKRYFFTKIPQIKLTEEEKTWIQQHPVVKFVSSIGSAPFAHIGKDGKIEGIIVDYIDILKKRTGINFEIDLPKLWTELIPMIQEKSTDGVACISKTVDREKYLTFTDNYLMMPWIIVTRNDFQGIALKLNALEGKKVAVIDASPAEKILKNHPKIIPVPITNPEQLWEAVSMGEVDAAFNTILSASYYIRKKGIMNLKIAGVIEESLKLCASVRKDLPELVAILNKAIATITPEEHEAIEKKWLSFRYEKGVDWNIVYRWIMLIGVISSGIIIVILIWNRKLAGEIEKRRQAEEQIRKLNAELEHRVSDRTAQLEAANKELETFCYSVSHDLRSPLRGIDGWSVAIMEDYSEKLDEQGHKFIDRIRTETHRMGQLIDDLLKLSRLTRAEMQLAPVNLSELAKSIADKLKEIDAARQIEFLIQPNLIAQADSGMMSIVLNNLIENAWKFSDKLPLSRIEFGALESNSTDRQTFFVKDNGAGFDMAYSSKLFGPFQRLHKASEFPGNGIGLATIQRIIHKHGGRVWAEGAINQGATFYFTL